MVLYGGLAIAAITDIVTWKIYNWLTFSMLAVGLLMAVSPGGIGIGSALAGAGAAFVLHWTLWKGGLEGAGDAKLMMAVGAFVGLSTMLEATVWRYLLLLPYAVVVLTVLRRWTHFRAALRWSLYRARGLPVGDRPEPTFMPFGPLIAIAVPVALNTGWLEFFG